MAKLQSALLLLAVVLLISTSPLALPQGRERLAQQRPEYLRGVLSRTVLKPPLQGDTEVRFSPDGKYLFIQDGQGIMLILRDPLQLITYISAPYVYPARFSSDSKSLILVSYNLAFSKWRVSDGVRMEFRDLNIPDGCLSAALSPTADFLACATSQMVFALYKLESGQKVFSWPLTFRRPPQARSALSIPDPAPALVRLDVKSAFSSPFGYILENDWKPIANHNVVRLPAWFSPDSKFVIVGNQLEFIRVDLTTYKKENLPSAIQKHFTEIVALQPGDRALTVDEDKHEIASFSLANGKMLSMAALSKDSVHAAQNSRFVLATSYFDQFGRVFDSQTNQFLPAVECIAFDVHDKVLAALSVNHSLNFFRLNQATPFLVVHLPLGDLAPLRSAAVSPNLDWLAFSVDGAGGIFQLPSGSPLPDSKPFNGAILSDNKDFVFFSLGRKKSDQLVSRFDFKSSTPSAGWTLAKEGELHPGQRAFLEYSFGPNSFSGRWLNSSFDDVPFVLRGIDPKT